MAAASAEAKRCELCIGTEDTLCSYVVICVNFVIKVGGMAKAECEPIGGSGGRASQQGPAQSPGHPTVSKKGLTQIVNVSWRQWQGASP